MHRIYLDNCCYCRPFDDLSYPKNKLESESVIAILSAFDSGKCSIVGSNILQLEIDKITDTSKRKKVNMLYSSVKEKILFNSEIEEVSEQIRAISKIKLFDSLHLACAAVGGVNYFITTDVKLEHMSKKLEIDFSVVNPVDYIMKVGD